MRKSNSPPKISLFPFLSVLLCTMGVLAFMAISFLLLAQKENTDISPKVLEIQWVGAPVYVKPIYVRCFENKVVYYDIFDKSEKTLTLNQLINQAQSSRGNLVSYLKKVVHKNMSIKQQFGKDEYYPLLLVYPKGVITSNLLMHSIEKIKDLNVGLEPMMPNWSVPYQAKSIGYLTK